MKSISEIRHRIASVSQTKQITQAMHLISIAKIKKAMARYESNLVYHNTVRSFMKDVLTHIPNAIDHPYLTEKNIHSHHALYIVIAGDKGMAGGYNENICRAALKRIQQSPSDEVTVWVIGNMAKNFFRDKGYAVEEHCIYAAQNPQLHHARKIVEDLLADFDDRKYDRVYVCYTEMISTMNQEPRVTQVLPAFLSEFEDAPEGIAQTEFITYEPSIMEVLNTLIPQYIVGELYGMLVQSHCSEYYMRMTAMDSATRNADEMLSQLNMEYNRVRQAAITQEVTEIISGVEALSKREES